MNKLKVRCVEVKSPHPDDDGNYWWAEYDCDDACHLNLWKGAEYRLRYEGGKISDEHCF